MGKIKEAFDDVYGIENSLCEPSEAEVERMQTQAILYEVRYIANEIEELLNREKYYNEMINYDKIERIHQEMTKILRAFQ